MYGILVRKYNTNTKYENSEKIYDSDLGYNTNTVMEIMNVNILYPI